MGFVGRKSAPLILAFAVLLLVGPANATVDASKGMSGTVGKICKFGGSTSFPVSINISGGGQGNRSARITFDGTLFANNALAVGNNYNFFCNYPSLKIVAPATSVNGSSTYSYSVAVRKGSLTASPLITVNSGSSGSFIPVMTTGDNTYYITITISGPPNGYQTGTYDATVTIQ
jgi:hypothetical protein